MEKSESIKMLASAFQAEVENVAKDGTNPFFKSKYATLENVITTVKPTLVKHGLSYAQFPQERGLYTIVMHTSGEFIGAWSAFVINDETPQGQGSAITYLRRYAELNTYQPERPDSLKEEQAIEYPAEDINPDDVPF
jgi:hypothetical protein